MASYRKSAVLIIGLCAVLFMAACAGPTTGNTGTPAPTSPPATATPKPKPTSAPKVTQAFCESVMTVAEANQIMNPPVPATTLRVQLDNELGVCAYLPAQGQFAVVKILIDQKAYTGPRPVPTSTILQLVSELANEPGATVNTVKPVSGVGDQAEFLEASVSASGMTFYVDVVYVIYGDVAFLCDDFHLNTKPDATAQQNALQQCGARTVSRL